MIFSEYFISDSDYFPKLIFNALIGRSYLWPDNIGLSYRVANKNSRECWRGRQAGIRMCSKMIIATANILLVGVRRDIKAINHCLSVLISVREIREIGSHKSRPADSALRLHSSWRYRFIVLKTHSGE